MTIERVLCILALCISLMTSFMSYRADKHYEYIVQCKRGSEWVTITAIGNEILSNPLLNVKVLTLYNGNIVSVMTNREEER